MGGLENCLHWRVNISNFYDTAGCKSLLSSVNPDITTTTPCLNTTRTAPSSIIVTCFPKYKYSGTPGDLLYEQNTSWIVTLSVMTASSTCTSQNFEKPFNSDQRYLKSPLPQTHVFFCLWTSGILFNIYWHMIKWIPKLLLKTWKPLKLFPIK